ncbi:hypothetical protein BH09VER1_BH09VER1_53200 [soil metagenome]
MNSPSSLIRKRKFAVAAGKANFELSRFTSGKVKTKDTTLVVISREEVENCDLTRFLGCCSPNHQDDRLAKLQGRVLFAIDGFDNEPEPLCTIPCVRNFYRLCHSRWPCWSFFGDLESDCLAMVAACVVPNLALVQRPRRKVEVTMLQPDLISFFEDCLPAAAYLHSRLGIEKFVGAKLLQRVSYYLQLPDRKN